MIKSFFYRQEIINIVFTFKLTLLQIDVESLQ